MKAKNLKPMIISALLAVGFGATTVGTSFALFTDSAETNISVTSGKVDVDLTIAQPTLTSADANAAIKTMTDENNAQYGVQSGWVNGGSATTNNGVITLSKMTPGDKAEFALTATNTSNVAIKYRYYVYAQNKNDKLLEALEVGIGNVKYTSLVKYYSGWKYAEAGAALTDAASEFGTVSFFMPINTGNTYQQLQTSYVVGIEAVQGNAYTTDPQLVETTAKNIETYEDLNKSAVAGESDLIISTTSQDEEVAVTATIPAAVEQVNAQDKVELTVSNVSKTTVPATNTMQIDFDVKLKVNNSVVSNFSEDIKVELYVGPNRDIASVIHHASTGDVAITDYSYNAVTGVVTFYSKSFSPFTVEYYELPDPDVYPVHIEKTGYETLDAALAAALNGDTISLSSDIEYSGNINIPDGKSIGIDLCGKNLETTKGMLINASTTVKIKDSSTGQLGRFAVLSDIYVAKIVGQGAKLTLDSGKIVQTSADLGIGIQNGGTFVMNDGVINAGYAGVFDWGNSTIIMNGGTINANDLGVSMRIDSSFTMNGGRINATGYGIGNWKNGRVVINDGEVYSGGYALFTNGGDSLFADIEVNGGKLISQGTAFYLAGCNTFKMTDGLIQGTMGVMMRAGTATISGGRIVATAEQVDLARGGESGFEGGDGVAFSFIQHTTKQDMILNVTGGSFEGKIGIHVSNFNDNDEYKNDPGTSSSVDGSSPLYDEFNNPVKAQFIVNMSNASFSNDCLCPVLITDSRYTVTLPLSVLNSLPSVLELPSATVTLSNNPAWLYVLAAA